MHKLRVRDEILSESFADFRKELITSKKEPVIHLLPKAKTKIDHNSNNNSRTTKYAKIMRGSKKETNIKQPVILQSSYKRTNALPSSTAYAFIKTSFPVEDEEELKFLPYFGDNDHEDIVSEVYDMSARAKMLMVGAEYRAREIEDIIDECRD